jgi:hypothetical protein
MRAMDDFYRIRCMEADVMIIEDFYYMVSVCNLKFTSVIMMKRNTATQQREALRKIINSYSKRGLHTSRIEMGGEALADALVLPPTMIVMRPPTSHVNTAERAIRTIKEQVRCATFNNVRIYKKE